MYTKSRAFGALLAVIFLAVSCLVIAVCAIDKNTKPEATWNEPVYVTTEPMVANVPTFTVGAMASTEPEVEEWIYPLSEEEINLIALVTMGEAEGETELGKRLVIDTILNRADDPHFPDNVTDVIYQPNQFSVMWNGRIDRCYIMPEIVELVKEELLERTNYDVIFFMAGGYSKYGKPLFQECCHYFSSYE
jgi:N-acetylmuramoyl-L-alanine amidase